MYSNMRRSQVARMQAQLNQMGFASRGSPFQLDDNGSDDDEEDGQEMVLAQQAGEMVKKGRNSFYNEKAGIDELGPNVFTFIDPSQGAKFQKTLKKVAEYATKEYGSEQYELIMYGKAPQIKEPTKPVKDSEGNIDEIELLDYKQDREWNKEETRRLNEASSKSFFLIVGQCVTPLRNALEALPDYPEARDNRNVVKLVEMMRTLIQGTEKKQNKYVRQWNQMKKLFKDTEQQDGEPDSIYGARLMAQAESAEKCGAVLLPEEAIGLDATKKLKIREEFLAAGIICNANKKKHGATMQYLKHEFMGGRNDIYKTTVAEAVDYLSSSYRNRNQNKGNEGVQLAQQDDADGDGKLRRWKCGKDGYTTRDCPRCAISAMAAKSKTLKGKKASQHLGAFR